MRKKVLILPIVMAFMALVLSGCEPLMVFDPKGPNARTLSNTILISIATMIIILLAVYIILAVVLTKYRASKLPADYEPPHEEGNRKLEFLWTAIPIVIVAFLAVVTIWSLEKVEQPQTEGYANKTPLVIYASSSEWKWHFSYPEEGIETVNYVNIPTDRPIEFRLYSYGMMTSFWVPQLAGQKYAMSDMVTKIHLAAEEEGEYFGRNSLFNGPGFEAQQFEVQAMKQADYDEWVQDVQSSEPKLTEEKFNELLNAAHVGRESFSSTHLSFSPAPASHADMMKAETYNKAKADQTGNGSLHIHRQQGHPAE
ncbi:cytochrome aa3 quinol oxidase subunit II [Kurthia senegalensis]|uniref:cytochrome aa3 quinol oxidase subunit II n=1 Tax=Kurthia senegalensis TaxID=1033740 RepID=UPI000287F23A|nr:cytochrome aa3 quinol oxidase subunit II [Kurthia senegalensis]